MCYEREQLESKQLAECVGSCITSFVIFFIILYLLFKWGTSWEINKKIDEVPNSIVTASIHIKCTTFAKCTNTKFKIISTKDNQKYCHFLYADSDQFAFMLPINVIEEMSKDCKKF